MLYIGSTLPLLVIIFLAVTVFSVIFSFIPLRLWIAALAAGVRVSLVNLFGLRLRRDIPSKVVEPQKIATKAGVDLNVNELEGHYLAGGNVDKVVNALIAAQRANIDLGFERAAAIDLAGRDVLNAVQMSVNPMVIETPPVAAVAIDGIELKAKARVTV